MEANATGVLRPGDLAQASTLISLGALVCVGDLLTVLVVCKFRSVTNPDILILALAVLDLLSAVVVFPTAVLWYLQPAALPDQACLVTACLTTAVQLASAVLVCLMTVDRFLAIRRPILYRTKLGAARLKRLVVVIAFLCAVVGSLPAVLSATNWTGAVNRHGYCTFRYASNFTYLVLALSLPQIPLLAYCSVGFLVAIQRFIKRRTPLRQRPVPSPGSSTASSLRGPRGDRAARTASSSSSSTPSPAPLRTNFFTWFSSFICRCFCYCCRWCRSERMKRKGVWKEEMVAEKTIKNLNLKRCTRMSKTVAIVVALYYIPWLLALVIMTIELIVGEEGVAGLSTLNLVMVRLMMAHSVFYPVVYATLCDNYRQAYRWALSLPFHWCGLRCHDRPPLGLSVSEMHRISHQMALEEWESPGLNRRLYSKRPHLKRSVTDSLKGAANVEDSEAGGRDNPIFDGAASGEPPPCDAALPEGVITVEVVHENAGRRTRCSSSARTDADALSVSVHQVADSPGLALPHPHSNTTSNPRGRRDSEAVAAQHSLENQTSDSGVDVDSVHLESAPSGSNSPAIYRQPGHVDHCTTEGTTATEDEAVPDDSSSALQTNQNPESQFEVETLYTIPETSNSPEPQDSNEELKGDRNSQLSLSKESDNSNTASRTRHVVQNGAISTGTTDIAAETDDVTLVRRGSVLMENGHAHPVQ